MPGIVPTFVETVISTTVFTVKGLTAQGSTQSKTDY